MNVHKPQTKQEAHEEALTGNLEAQYTVGEQLDLIVLESPQDNNGREAYARDNDVSVFIYPDRLDLYTGTHVRARVSEVGDNHLKAVALAVLD
jgi:tRNA A37 methylthiotransferase MiaB